MYHPFVYMTAECKNGSNCPNRFCAFFHSEQERKNAETNRAELLKKLQRSPLNKSQNGALAVVKPPAPSLSSPAKSPKVSSTPTDSSPAAPPSTPSPSIQDHPLPSDPTPPPSASFHSSAPSPPSIPVFISLSLFFLFFSSSSSFFSFSFSLPLFSSLFLS